MRLHIEGETFSLKLPLLSLFNIDNVLCTVAMARACGVNASTIAQSLPSITLPAGRLTCINQERSEEPRVWVDFSHTPDSLEKALRFMRETTEKKVIAVFGCGGDRDRQKRPLMASIAEHGADQVIITSDNPRNENPLDIIEEIKRGLSADAKHIWIEPDRKKAIELAVSLASQGDSLLIAGKGHESIQIVGDLNLPFSDFDVAAEALKTHYDASC